jgi:nitroreductase
MNIPQSIKKPLIKIYGYFLARNYKLRIGFYHLRRSLKYAANKNNRNGWIAALRVSCHILEKGLTMPNTRYGFGQSRILAIVDNLKNNRQYEKEEEYLYAIGLLKEYLDLHDRNQQELPTSYRKAIEDITSRFPEIEPVKQIDITSDMYFADINAPFNVLVKSRRTIRYFEDAAPYEDVVEAVRMAGYAPSACNRQSVKCHYFEGEKVQEILKVQTGNRGFGHLAPQLIVLTSDASMVGAKEYNDSFTNAGIFAMNLSYALYHKKIASCILNWSVLSKDDKKLRKIAGIPFQETIVLIIILGKTPKEFKIAVSKRQPVEEYLIKH